MGWKSLLFGFAALVALGFGALADAASVDDQSADAREVAAVQLPPRSIPAVPRGSEGTAQPRYSVMPMNGTEFVVADLRRTENGLDRLGRGDTLRLIVFGEKDLSGDFAVDPQGYIRLPLIGSIRVAGLTAYGLEARLAEALSDGGYLTDPNVSVEVVSRPPLDGAVSALRPADLPPPAP